MREKIELEKDIIQLKLEKRYLILSGQSTNEIDNKIRKQQMKLEYVQATGSKS